MLIRMYACIPFHALQGVCEDFIDSAALIYLRDLSESCLSKCFRNQILGVFFVCGKTFLCPMIQLLVSPVLIDKNLDKQNRTHFLLAKKKFR